MLHNIKFTSALLFSMLVFISSCTKEDKTFGDLTPPSAPVIDVLVVGKTASAPYGDSTGKIIVTITSSNAINYKVSFGDGGADSVSTKNEWQYNYTHIGLKNLIVTVTTTGKGGLASTTVSASFSIYRKYLPNPDLVTMLTNDGSKTWKVDSAAAGNIGVGPTATFTPDYYAAAPNEKAGVGLYDDEFTFTKSTNTFTHKTNNSIFGHKDNLKDFDPTLTGTGDYTLTGIKAAAYSEGFSYDGTGTAEYIIFASKGHMGIYLGGHKYQILARSATQMWLRYIGTDGNAWYVKIKSI